MADQSSKRYPASERKLQHLRRAGAQPCSPGVSGAIALLAGLMLLLIAGRMIVWQPLVTLLQTSLQATDHSPELLIAWIGHAAQVGAIAVAPIGVIGLCGWLLGNLLQTNFALRLPWARSTEVGYYSMPRRRPDPLVRSILAALLLASVAASVMALLRTVQCLHLEAGRSPGEMLLHVWPALGIFVPAVVAVIGLDWLWSQYCYIRASKMTEAERRRELKDAEVSWLVRRRINRRRYGGTR